MKSFRIISTSWVLAILSMLLITFSGVFLLIKFLTGNSNISIIAALSLIGVGLYLQRFISTAKIEIVLTQEFVTIKWLKQYLFHKEPDRKIFFDEIKSYKYEEDQNFDLFQIILVNDTELNFYHFTFTKDDFETLVNTFPDFVNRHNTNVENILASRPLDSKLQRIERSKTIYENPTSPFIVVFAILLILTVPIIFLVKGDKVSNPFLALAAISGGLFYLIEYFQYRRGKNKKNN